MSIDIHELAAGYALDALDAADRELFEPHLATCSDCQADVRAHQETARLLGSTVSQQPPAALKNDILSAIAGIEQDQVSDLAETAPKHGVPITSATAPVAEVIDLRSRRRNRVLKAVAAAVILFGVIFGLQELNNSAMPSEFAAILESSDAQEAVLTGEGDAQFRVVWSASSGEFAVRGENVPEISSDQTYEFWFVGDGDPVNAGLFTAEDGTVEFDGELPGDPALWGITIEPAGGSPAPTSDIIYSVSL